MFNTVLYQHCFGSCSLGLVSRGLSPSGSPRCVAKLPAPGSCRHECTPLHNEGSGRSCTVQSGPSRRAGICLLTGVGTHLPDRGIPVTLHPLTEWLPTRSLPLISVPSASEGGALSLALCPAQSHVFTILATQDLHQVCGCSKFVLQDLTNFVGYLKVLHQTHRTFLRKLAYLQ